MIVKSFEKYYHYKKGSSYSFDGHRHSEYEANIVLDGALEVTCGESVFLLKKGEMAVWWAGLFHRNRVVSDCETDFISLHFDTDEQILNAPTFFLLTELDTALISVIDDELICEGDEQGRITPASEMLLGGLFERLYSRKAEPVQSLDASAMLYRRAVGIMRERLHEDPSVADIARGCGVCVTLLKNAFSRYAGKGVKEYFIEMKIEQAKARLLRGERSESIAGELGFSSPSYFSQTFSRVLGMSPREFLRER